MSIEEEIFKKSKIDYSKLTSYGFKENLKDYTLSKNILDNTFRVDIKIEKTGTIEGKIYDLNFNEEYLNYRMEKQKGKFSTKVREEFQNILIDIKNNCTITNYFLSNQANRICELIKEKYNDLPEFIWEKYPGFVIFRNPTNNKWYGLIMNINKSKIDNESQEEIEILNLKLNKEKIIYLLNKKGFYKAYHMNKTNWITIILDDTIKDNEIMDYIIESHKYTEK